MTELNIEGGGNGGNGGNEDNNITVNFSIILKSFNKLDNYIAKYIYNKYIETSETSEPNSSLYKYSKKTINQEEYNKYINSIFNIERPGIITQKDSLKIDLETMALADESYDKDPKNFKVRQFNRLPCLKRCSYIRKHKNKYKRCNINVMNDDTDTCYKHIDSPNMYWDKYCKALEEIV